MNIQNIVTIFRLRLNTHMVAKALRRITQVLAVTNIAATMSKLNRSVKKNDEHTRHSRNSRTCQRKTAYNS